MNIHKLALAIESQRKQLNFYVDKYGIQSLTAIKCSEELDKLIYVYQQSKNDDPGSMDGN